VTVFLGFVDDTAKLTLDVPRQFRAYLQRLKGEEVEVEIRKRRSKRSGKQNAYWHGVVVALLAQECGYTPDEMHQALKAKFLGEDDLRSGLRRIGSTAKLNTQQFVELTDRVVLWAAEDLGVIIPQPEKDIRKKGRAA
jgi:hypothetical protein